MKSPPYKLLPQERDAAKVEAEAVSAALARARKGVRALARVLKRIHGSGVAAARACGVSAVYWSQINTGRAMPSNKIIAAMLREVERGT